MLKHREGDTVRIRSRAWIDAQEAYVLGGITPAEGYKCVLSESMYVYAGRTAKIVELYTHVDRYRLDVDDQRFVWEDWMFVPEYEADGEAADGGEDKPIPAEDAIRAMLDGETLYGVYDRECRWDNGSGSFLLYHTGYKNRRITFFGGLRRRPARRKRAMNRFEILAWAGGEASYGWVVRYGPGSNWLAPQGLSYESRIESYQRARILPDGSGIDESTIQGFEVET
jgi:hypothetical protein